LEALGAWLRHVRDANGTVDDPMSAELTKAVNAGDLASIMAQLFGPDGKIASSWQPTSDDLVLLAFFRT
jgi:fructuronate reductase